jgi:hypothetical protein
VYENYLKRKQIEWKESAKEKKKKKKTEKGIFSPGWLYNQDWRWPPEGLACDPFSPSWYKEPGLKSPNQSRLACSGLKGGI